MIFDDVGLATTPAEIARRRRDQTAGALPILGWAIGPMPIIRLDCTERPDVADLVRVFEFEPGAGAVRTSWKFMLDARGADSLFSAHVVFEAPVVCRFTIAFTARERALLHAIAASGWFAVTPEPLRGEVRMVIINANAEPLRLALEMQAIGAALPQPRTPRGRPRS